MKKSDFIKIVILVSSGIFFVVYFYVKDIKLGVERKNFVLLFVFREIFFYVFFLCGWCDGMNYFRVYY